MDDQYLFYCKLDEFHRPRKIYRHKLGSTSKKDELIFEEKSDAFTVGINLSADEKYFIITTSDHNTSEQYYFSVNEKKPNPKLIKKRKKVLFIRLLLGTTIFTVILMKMQKILKLKDAIIYQNKIGKFI